MSRELERVTHDVMLERRRVDGGRRIWVAIVAAGKLTPADQLRAVARAREVLKDDPRPVEQVECVYDELEAKGRKKRARARLQ